MNEIERLRTAIRSFEDKRLGTSRLGREILHVADLIRDDRRAQLRQALVRLGHRFVALAERARYDDIETEVRNSVDELHDEILTVIGED